MRSVQKQNPKKKKRRRRGGVGAGVSQGHGGAGVFELAGQHSSVQLVELHQVDQVGELGGAVVQAEEHLAVLLALSHQADSGGEREREGENNRSFTDSRGTRPPQFRKSHRFKSLQDDAGSQAAPPHQPRLLACTANPNLS